MNETASVPTTLPSFIANDPPPEDWQERIAAIDPALRIARNTIHPDGPRWCVVRFAPRPALWGTPNALVGFGEFAAAMQGDWAFVRDLVEPVDGKPIDLVDAHILDLFDDDFWRRYGREHAPALGKMDKEKEEISRWQKDFVRRAADDAFASANSDRTIVADLVTFDMGAARKPRGKIVTAFR